jgi:hypothetical protein
MKCSRTPQAVPNSVRLRSDTPQAMPNSVRLRSDTHGEIKHPFNILALPGKIKLPVFRQKPEDGYEIVRMNRR